MFDDMANRADRAMRTMSARRAAEETYQLMLGSTSPASTERASLLAALAARRGWRQENERNFVCTFGTRRSTLTVPSPFDAIQLIRLITRVEINVFLGDSEPTVLADLQALAQRELHQLLASE